MLSKNPIMPDYLTQESVDCELVRIAIAGELDAISLYEQAAQMTENKDLQKVLEDIAKEEKTHVGEFLALLKKADTEQANELENGAKEVTDLTID
jgi:rubrerythrin